MSYASSYGDGCGMLYVKLVSLDPVSEQSANDSSKYFVNVRIWDRDRQPKKAVRIGSEINKTFIFEGIVYYGNTLIKISLKRERFGRKAKVIATGSFRLLNSIYRKWMEERQGKQGDHYAALTERTEFTPSVSFLSEEQSIAYTLPFQRISIPLFLEDHSQMVVLNAISLFIPYSVRKPYENRPPLMHMAAIINDVALLKRAVDIDNRSELWNYKGFNPLTIAFICRFKPSYEFLVRLHEQKSFIQPSDHPSKNVFHYTAMCGDPHFLRVIMNGMPNKRDFPSYLSMADEEGETPIFSAIRSHDGKMVQMLMRCGSLLDVRNNHGDTPLMVAIQEHQELIAISFSSYSRVGPNRTRVYYACPGAVNHKGQTALMLAAREGMLLLVRCLLRCKVSEMTVDCEGHTVLQYALEAKQHQYGIVSSILGLKEGKGRVNTELVAMTFANGEEVDKLLEKSEPSVKEKLMELKKAIGGKKNVVFIEEDDLYSIC